MIAIHDDRRCELGEGPLWHPEREQLFWFDILGKRPLSRHGEWPQDGTLPSLFRPPDGSDRDTLLIASESSLFRFNLLTGRAVDRLRARSGQARHAVE